MNLRLRRNALTLEPCSRPVILAMTMGSYGLGPVLRVILLRRLTIVALLLSWLCLSLPGLTCAQDIKPPAFGAAAASRDSAIKGALPPEKSQPIQLPRLDRPPVIDGKLDDEVWQHAAVFKNFYQWRPSDSAPASAQTETLAGYDSRFLYFAFRAYDDPAKVRATVAKRDSIFDDDVVGLLLDTFNDKRRAYEFFFNPLGIQQDGILTEGGDDDFSVDVVMDSKGSLTADGYVVEIAIPFKSLRYEAGKGKLWGLHLIRQIKHYNGEQDSWMPISQNQNGILNQAGHITGLEGISTERTLEVIPSLTVSETGTRVAQLLPGPLPGTFIDSPHGRFVNGPLRADIGLTAKYTVTPTVTLDLALNPDFAQVEADQTVVTANQRFPIFFEEKRPFFLEGIDYFRTPFLAVHTRSIVDPDVAAKLTGKRGRNTFGIMFASDNAPGNLSPDERKDPTQSRFAGKNALVGVIRLKRDYGAENSFGLLFTTYDFGNLNRGTNETGLGQAPLEKHNRLAGFDGRVRLNKQTTINFQVIGTYSRRFFFEPELGQSVFRTGNAFAYTFQFNNETKHWTRNYEETGRTRFYRAEVGFTRRTNTNNGGWFIQYRSEPKPKAALTRWRLFTAGNHNFDWQGRMQSWNENTQLQAGFQHEAFVGLGVERGYERLFEEEFGTTRNAPCITRPEISGRCSPAFAGRDNERSSQQRTVYAYAGATPSKKYNFFFFAAHNWGQFDFDFGAGPRFPRVSPVGLLDADGPLDPGPGSQVHIEGNITYQPSAALRNSLSFSKDRLKRYDTNRVAFDDNIVTLRSTYQFSRFTFARARIDFGSLESKIKGEFLLGWTPNPGTAFYVGYNDDLARNGFSPFTGELEPGFRRNGRTFFVKMSYLFRKSFGG